MTHGQPPCDGTVSALHPFALVEVEQLQSLQQLASGGTDHSLRVGCAHAGRQEEREIEGGCRRGRKRTIPGRPTGLRCWRCAMRMLTGRGDVAVRHEGEHELDAECRCRPDGRVEVEAPDRTALRTIDDDVPEHSVGLTGWL